MARACDERQMKLGLSDALQTAPEPEPMPGSLNFDLELRALLAKALKGTTKSRAQVAADMTDLIYGDTEAGQITAAQLNSWTAGSHESWRFPAAFLPAFLVATGATFVLERLADKCGCQILVGEEAVLAEAAALRAVAQNAQKRLDQLTRKISPETAQRVIARAEARRG
jgi:hypothetical protein